MQRGLAGRPFDRFEFERDACLVWKSHGSNVSRSRTIRKAGLISETKSIVDVVGIIRTMMMEQTTDLSSLFWLELVGISVNSLTVKSEAEFPPGTSDATIGCVSWIWISVAINNIQKRYALAYLVFLGDVGAASVSHDPIMTRAAYAARQCKPRPMKCGKTRPGYQAAYRPKYSRRLSERL